MIELEIQNPFGFDTIPENTDLNSWVDVALQDQKQKSSMVIRFVDEAEGLDLNHTYRGKKSTTNVLSFPFEKPDFLLEMPELDEELAHLGDLVLCEPVILKEAAQQNKSKQQHWAHLIVHGTLHLQGYEHLNDEDATIMEALEVEILKKLGFDNPYKEK